jgi:hypothetical protein
VVIEVVGGGGGDEGGVVRVVHCGEGGVVERGAWAAHHTCRHCMPTHAPSAATAAGPGIVNAAAAAHAAPLAQQHPLALALPVLEAAGLEGAAGGWHRRVAHKLADWLTDWLSELVGDEACLCVWVCMCERVGWLVSHGVKHKERGTWIISKKATTIKPAPNAHRGRESIHVPLIDCAGCGVCWGRGRVSASLFLMPVTD